MNGMAKLPSALLDFQIIERQLKGKRLAVFLDYDGTLTPIRDRPELAVLSDVMHQRLDRLGGLYPTAIVSGRAVQEVKDLVGVDDLFYAGSHGFDIVGPRGSGVRYEVGKRFVPTIEHAHALLCSELREIDGVIIENKVYSLSVHYRLVKEERVPAIEQVIDQVLRQHPTLCKTHGKKVLEVRPRVDWHKGKAVQWILGTIGSMAMATVALYVGDDTTDEDAFKVTAESGIGVLVTSEPRLTAAQFVLEDSEAVGIFLERIADLNPNSEAHGQLIR